MPISKQRHYRERVLTGVISNQIDNDHGLQDAAHHVIKYDDNGALRWMADRIRDNVDVADSLGDKELQGAVEWYLRDGSSKSYV